MGSLTGAAAWVAPEVGASGRWDPSHARAVAPHDDRWWDGRMPSATPPADPHPPHERPGSLSPRCRWSAALVDGRLRPGPHRADDPAHAPRDATTTVVPGGTASEVRLARVGGVAGFQDVLVVAPDGSVTGTTRAGAVDCTVPAGDACRSSPPPHRLPPA